MHVPMSFLSVSSFWGGFFCVTPLIGPSREWRGPPYFVSHSLVSQTPQFPLPEPVFPFRRTQPFLFFFSAALILAFSFSLGLSVRWRGSPLCRASVCLPPPPPSPLFLASNFSKNSFGVATPFSSFRLFSPLPAPPVPITPPVPS